MAFPEKERKEIKKIIRRSFQNLGLSIIEMLITPRIYKYFQIKGGENFPEEGGLITGIHEGNYELFNFALAQQIKFAVLVKKQKNEDLDKFLNDLRQEYNLKICLSLKELIRYLKANFFIGLTLDHGAEDNALLIDFFSHLVPTPGGIVYLAKKFNKKIYPCFDRRIKGFHHIGEVLPSVDPAQGDEKEMLTTLNKTFEQNLRKYPQEYIWSYKRFKRKKDLNVLILSDNKLGHLKQSQALLSFIAEEDYVLRSKTIEIKCKNKAARLFSEICSYFSGKECLGCGACLKFMLSKKTYLELEKTYADIIISTGSSLAPINKIFSSYLSAKSVVILKPNISLKKFDMAIIPKHDRVNVTAKNIVEIKGALAYPAEIEEKAQKCRDFFKLGKNRKIAIFIGGPANDKAAFINNLEIFLKNLKIFAEGKDYKLLISTSRRTPAQAQALIKEELEGFKNSEAIVYAHQANYDFVFNGFVSLSDIVFTTAESVSMISEIGSLKKACVCVFLERHVNKHNVFLESIKNEVNFLKKPYNIPNRDTLKISSIFEENKAAIKNAIKKQLIN
jgi:KDO2-lipid IV(A) lauroyltransferase